ncbi:hypothetical protein G8C92_27640 [Paenibacillus donghaensis]|uniref:DUF6508 domain-containing protein n=1 Tax=Paenibacillus donghaensis TaxID=414771 RepID=UPI001883688B|nr:DUF6508 domain-containing protein [Paenibacillus donghaensis]MBE9917778.1 hypothetical protein [Paenibacillus donghaensis]
MPYDEVITQKEADRLLPYLEIFQDPGQILYTQLNGYICEAEPIGAFRKELEETGFLMVFDWKSWIGEHEMYKDVRQNIQPHIMSSDVETLRKLLTSYVRGDRFSEGLFVEVVTNGKVVQILERLKELRSSLPE